MTVSLIGFAILFLIAFLGFPLGFAMFVVGGIGFALLRGTGPAMEMVVQQTMDVVLNTNFAVLPMFLLMGAFVYRAGLSDDLYEAADAWLGHHRGGLAMATIAACGGFAAVSGSSLATVATMAKVAIPSMRKYNYSDSLAAGTIAAGGTLGILIPPSAALIIYGILTEEGIAELFAAGIIPGIISIVLYIIVIRIITHYRATTPSPPPGIVSRRGFERGLRRRPCRGRARKSLERSTRPRSPRSPTAARARAARVRTRAPSLRGVGRPRRSDPAPARARHARSGLGCNRAPLEST